MSSGVVAMTVTVTREENQDGWWYVAQSGEHCIQAKSRDDVQYEFERALVCAQAVRGELLPRQYQIAYVFHSTLNVLSDGERVTGWADEEGVPVDNIGRDDCDHDWIYSRAGKYCRVCVACGMRQTDSECRHEEGSSDE